MEKTNRKLSATIFFVDLEWGPHDNVYCCCGCCSFSPWFPLSNQHGPTEGKIAEREKKAKHSLMYASLHMHNYAIFVLWLLHHPALQSNPVNSDVEIVHENFELNKHLNYPIICVDTLVHNRIKQTLELSNHMCGHIGTLPLPKW